MTPTQMSWDELAREARRMEKESRLAPMPPAERSYYAQVCEEMMTRVGLGRDWDE